MPEASSKSDIEMLATFLADNRSFVVLGGAGVSTASGIPDYRDEQGNWKLAMPMQVQEFRRSAAARKRYWARSFSGWQRFSVARPNAAHRALAELECRGKIEMLITQNVDGLHSQAGNQKVIDLHGNLAKVRCIDCGETVDRAVFQQQMTGANPDWQTDILQYRPDGDAVLDTDRSPDFSVPACTGCGGIVKPDVVMFGESVPRSRVNDAYSALDRAAGLLVVGSSLMVYSGYRFARHASNRGIPIGIINLGRTRADELATLKIRRDCGAALSAALEMSF